MKDKFIAAIQDVVDNSNATDAAIVEKIYGLNYFGKKLDKSREAVVTLICEELEVDAAHVRRIAAQEFDRRAAEPAKKKPKAKQTVDESKPVAAGEMNHTEKTRPVIAGKRFIISSIQNNTHVHAKFLAALEFYAGEIGAELLIYPFIYNKNAFQNGEGGKDIWYACEVTKYLQTETVWLGEGCKVAAMAFNILPTAKNPLAGLSEAIGTAEAMIVPHATIAHENIAVLGAQYGAVVPGMYSTGTVGLRNYIQQAAGQKAENRHNFGALIVEFNEHGQFWIRQIETDESGEFQDLRNVVSCHINDEWAVYNNDISVINYGDIHAEKLDSYLAATLWNQGGMLDYFQPEYQMLHDLLDFSSLNHHNRDNPHHNAKVNIAGETVEKDLQHVAHVLDWIKRDYCETVVVRSNHDDALDRWLMDMKYDPRKDPANAMVYYQLQVAALTAFKNHEHFDALPIALRNLSEDGYFAETVYNVVFLKASESFKINGVELGEHGHSGKNGSRGSPKQFANQRMTTGHTHTSSIYGGCYTAGVTGKLAMGYNETGASSWTQSCVIQYPTGFRAVIHVKDNGAGELGFMA